MRINWDTLLVSNLNTDASGHYRQLNSVLYLVSELIRRISTIIKRKGTNNKLHDVIEVIK